MFFQPGLARLQGATRLRGYHHQPKQQTLWCFRKMYWQPPCIMREDDPKTHSIFLERGGSSWEVYLKSCLVTRRQSTFQEHEKKAVSSLGFFWVPRSRGVYNSKAVLQTVLGRRFGLIFFPSLNSYS